MGAEVGLVRDDEAAADTGATGQIGHRLRALGGIEAPVRGTITLPGGVPAPRGQRAHVAAGVAYVSGDRRRFGLMLDKPVWENVVQVRTMAMGGDGAFLRTPRLAARAAEHMRRLNIKAASPEAAAGSLSGGNQQKVVLAKWLDNAPSTIVLDDPTRGVDIGAKAEIHGLLVDLAAAGAVVVLGSTDLEELVAVCDRVIVLYQGAHLRRAARRSADRRRAAARDEHRRRVDGVRRRGRVTAGNGEPG